ncbi:MAG: PulJ/GspJ family protein [Aeromonadaceae bacterium]
MRNKFLRGQAGFTILELMVVVVMLGILGTVGYKMFGSGVTSKARAMQKYDLTTRLVNLMGVVAQSGAGTAVTTNPFFKSGAGLLDVLVGGEECVSANYQRSYRSFAVATYEESMNVTTRPNCSGGTATAGVYKVDKSGVKVSGTDGTMSVIYDNVTSDELEAIVESHGDSKDFDKSSTAAGSDGSISWGAPAGGLYTVTIKRKV